VAGTNRVFSCSKPLVRRLRASGICLPAGAFHDPNPMKSLGKSISESAEIPAAEHNEILILADIETKGLLNNI
jgi:hypothetical protein